MRQAPTWALLAGLLAIATLAPAVHAYTVVGATFVPDHGAPGASIVVEGLPLVADCPGVEVWLARHVTPTTPVLSPADPRLIRLVGAVRVRPIGAGGTGDTRPATTFEFRVPDIAAGTYATYARCVGGTSDFAGFGGGATPFTVEPAAPGTDAAGPSFAPAGHRDAILATIGTLAFAFLLVGVARRHGAGGRRPA